MSLALFDFKGHLTGVAWSEFIICAIHQEVQRFSHDGPNECRRSIWLQDRLKRTAAAEKLDSDLLDKRSLCGAAIRVLDGQLS
jgi:hypothetical protein